MKFVVLAFLFLFASCHSEATETTKGGGGAEGLHQAGSVQLNADKQAKIVLKLQAITGKIPESARVWHDGKVWIYQRQGEQVFVRVEVDSNHAGKLADVVVQGAQILLSEEFKNNLPEDD